MVRRFWYFELPNSSKLAAPVPCGGGETSANQPPPPPTTPGRRGGDRKLLGRFLPGCAEIGTDLRAKKTNKTSAAVATATVATATSHLADHGGEVASVEQRVLSVSHSGGVFEGLLVGKRPPLRAHVDDAIT